MPNRVVRESILESDKVNSVNWAQEVFYRRLMSIVDDFGRYEDNSKLLRAKLYPVLLDRVSLPDVEKWKCECVEAGLIRLYEINGKKYLQIEEFNQTVRIKKPKYPPPPCIADAYHLQADAPETKRNETETKVEPPQVDLEKELLNSPKWHEEVAIHFRIKVDQVKLHLRSFITEQKASERFNNRDLGDLKKHFVNWGNKKGLSPTKTETVKAKW